jgi:hypothetical protein
MNKMNVKNVFHRTTMFAIIILSVASLFVACLYQSPNLLAQSDNTGIIDLSQPLYSEHFKVIGQKEVTINGTKVTQAMFSGNGTTKGISITSIGKGLIFSRPDGVVYIKGKADFIPTPSSSSSNDRQAGKATYTFQAIGNYGVALFNPNASGSLSFLSNTVAVYKVDMDKNGTNTFTMWKWGK